jgi:hypothetical protein
MQSGVATVPCVVAAAVVVVVVVGSKGKQSGLGGWHVQAGGPPAQQTFFIGDKAVVGWVGTYCARTTG